jgi:hypothetical protein
VPASNCAQSEPNAFADIPGCANPKSQNRSPNLECSSQRWIWLALTLALSPEERESPGPTSQSSNHTRSPSFRNRSATARTTALSFAQWLRKASYWNSDSIAQLVSTTPADSAATPSFPPPQGEAVQAHALIRGVEVKRHPRTILHAGFVEDTTDNPAIGLGGVRVDLLVQRMRERVGQDSLAMDERFLDSQTRASALRSPPTCFRSGN